MLSTATEMGISRLDLLSRNIGSGHDPKGYMLLNLPGGLDSLIDLYQPPHHVSVLNEAVGRSIRQTAVVLSS